MKGRQKNLVAVGHRLEYFLERNLHIAFTTGQCPLCTASLIHSILEGNNTGVAQLRLAIYVGYSVVPLGRSL